MFGFRNESAASAGVSASAVTSGVVCEDLACDQEGHREDDRNALEPVPRHREHQERSRGYGEADRSQRETKPGERHAQKGARQRIEEAMNQRGDRTVLNAVRIESVEDVQRPFP